jgi:hypothetical protein
MWKPLGKRTCKDSCRMCNGSGGLYDDETIGPIDGLPQFKPCPACSGEEWELAVARLMGCRSSRYKGEW